MDRSACWLCVLLCCWPLAVRAGNAALRVTPLPAAPGVMGVAITPPATTPATAEGRIWLRAPHRHVAWYALQPTANWTSGSPPLLSIGGNTRARVTVYLPPGYAPRTDSVFEASLDPAFSHHAVVYPLPAGWRTDQPVYVALGDPGQTQPIQLRIMDAHAYRTADLWHVRASTFFASAQWSMVMVILCFWIVLRDRMFLYFIAYVSAQAIYGMTVSGELFVMPGAGLLAPLGYHTGQCMAALAAGFSIWFILAFADLRRRTPRMAAWLGALRWPYFAAAVVVWLPFLAPDVWLPNSVNVLLIFSTVLALAASWATWRQGDRAAGFLLLSWVPLLALTVTRVVQLVAGFPLPMWLEYGFPASMAWSAVIITVGLADSTLQVRHERDDAARMAQFDALTGVFNRRGITERLARAWQVATGVPEPLAVLFLDIDHFKHINDTRGHAAGDACLCAVTDAIRAELGNPDRVGRYGGEEFVVMLRGDSARMARRVAERIAARAAALAVSVGEHVVTLTVSIGVAVRDLNMVNAEALVGYADAAQYRAKAEGRNRVVVWERTTAEVMLVGPG